MNPIYHDGRHGGRAHTGWSRATGFTLIEVLIAASILSIVAVILYGSFSTVLNSVERVRNELELMRIADFLVTHFEKNISGAYLPLPTVGLQTASFVGTDQEVNGRPADSLAFVTTAARMAGGALPGDTKEVVYGLIEIDDGLYAFTASEKPRLLLPRTGWDQAGDSITASWSVPMASLDFKYSDEGQLYDAWDSGEMGKLPSAVHIEARFVTEEIEQALDKMGVQKTAITMVVAIPVGPATRMEGE